MLVRFNIKNFLSFNDRIAPETNENVSIEFSMIPGKAKLNSDQIIKSTSQNLLKFGAIYGANASGKSNLIKALSFFQTMVQNGKLPTSASELYCKIDKNNKTKPSYFEIEILLDDTVYSYGFEVILSQNIIISEWLVRIDKDTEIKLFYKDGADNSYHFDDVLKDNQALNIYQQGILGANTLFLTEMNKDKIGFYMQNPTTIILTKVYSWICNNLETVFPNKLTQDASFMINTSSLDKVAELLHSFGTGIINIKEIPEDLDKVLYNLPSSIKNELTKQIETFKTIKNRHTDNSCHFNKISFLTRSSEDIIKINFDFNTGINAYSIQFMHENIEQDILFRASEESDGTLRLFELIEILLSDSEKTYIIDDLDKYLHTCLSYNFIKRFFEYSTNKKVQLLTTTHETKLMDLKLLRRDEIWFVDKDKKGNSSIYSLEEYNTRFDQKVDKAYLEGRYGRVPSFNSLYSH